MIHHFIENEYLCKISPCQKSRLSLGSGEPRKENGFPIPEIVNEEVIKVLKEGLHNGYTASSGDIIPR